MVGYSLLTNTVLENDVNQLVTQPIQTKKFQVLPTAVEDKTLRTLPVGHSTTEPQDCLNEGKS